MEYRYHQKCRSVGRVVGTWVAATVARKEGGEGGGGGGRSEAIESSQWGDGSES